MSVFDPFAGTASAGMAAKDLNCNYVGIEINQDLAQAANGRLTN